MFPSTPIVKLGQHFQSSSQLLKRFASIPDMVELDHLTISGDVTLGKHVSQLIIISSSSHLAPTQVSLKGTVIIIANHGERIDIPAGSVLENKIVSGNLRIMDH